MTRTTILFALAIAAALAPHPARADARTVMWLKGVAYGIAQECPTMRVDADAVRKTKRVEGNKPGDVYDFQDGVTYAAQLLKSKEQSCDSICGVRPGTCYFIKD